MKAINPVAPLTIEEKQALAAWDRPAAPAAEEAAKIAAAYDKRHEPREYKYVPHIFVLIIAIAILLTLRNYLELFIAPTAVIILIIAMAKAMAALGNSKKSQVKQVNDQQLLVKTYNNPQDFSVDAPKMAAARWTVQSQSQGSVRGNFGVTTAKFLVFWPALFHKGADKITVTWVRDGEMKKCPECAELVLSEARICRYCRHEFVPRVA
jgi:hypothetical protein